MKQVIVIGGGASGMLAAIASARGGAKTTLLEAGEKPGRKLLLTGNGRCNLTNLNDEILSVYDSSDRVEAKKLLESVFGRFSVRDTLDFFHGEGLLTSVEHGTCVYPVTGQSGSVVGILLRTLRSLGVKMKFSEEVVAIEKNESDDPGDLSSCRWMVRTKTWTYQADSVIISCGSRSVPSTGSNGSGYELCRLLGLDVTDILPGLTAVMCSLPAPDTRAYIPGSGKKEGSGRERGASSDPLFQAAGTRTFAHVTVLADGERIASECGQIQITQSDLSGIVVFNLSRSVVRALHKGRSVTLSLDLLPDFSVEDLEKLIADLRGKFPDAGDGKLLEGLVPSRLIPAVLESAAQSGRSLACVLKEFTLNASGLRGFDSTQVCVGGVRVTELNPDTLECHNEDLKGIYLTGELIDIDGPCGGYNLQWAWSSGYTAGIHAAQEES